MSDAEPVIDVRDVHRGFDVFARPLDMLLESLWGRQRHQTIWALKGISFTVDRGEVLGILGPNGAGKTTLLRVLAGTLVPTSGEARINGKASAILELGAGFHPDMSGRENIFLGALCLGARRAETQARLESVIAFSELGDWIDRPLRTYSTGMRARLAFSVAISLNPDVLIVDEALAVGDVRFQRKCYAEFEALKEQGRTIIFVTHAPHLVELICDRALYLRDGAIVAAGAPRDVAGRYLEDMFGGDAGALPAADDSGSEARRYGDGRARIVEVGILNSQGHATSQVTSGDSCTIFSRIRCETERIDDLMPGISITTREGVVLFAVNPLLERLDAIPLERGQVLEARVSIRLALAPGDYFATFGAWGLLADTHYDRRVDALHIKVSGEARLSQSLVNLEPEYRLTLLPEDEKKRRVT